MPRLRYLKNEILELRAFSPKKTPVSMRSYEEIDRLRRAGRLALTATDFTELLGDIDGEATFRQIAARRATSAATEWRRRPQLLAAVQQAYLAIRLTDELGGGNGISLDPRSGLPLSELLDTGYLVSIKQFGQSFRTRPTPHEALQWLHEQSACLSSYYPGAWIDDPSVREKYCLDMNMWVLSKTEALAIAREQAQKAIFDLRANSPLWVARHDQREAA